MELAMIRRVVIVGGGPAGSASAVAMGRSLGLEVVILDAASFPRDKICAGGLSPNAQAVLAHLGLRDEVLAEAHAIGRLRLVGPGGEEWSLGRARSVVLPRLRFDHLMVRAAQRSGATLREGVRVKGLLRERGHVRGVSTSEGDLEADLVIVAAGVLAGAKLARTPRDDDRPERRFLAVERRYEGWAFDPGAMEMIYAKGLLPGYGWVFPESPVRANVGICIDDSHPERASLHRLLDEFLDRHLGARLKGAVAVDNVRGQPIAWRDTVPELSEPGALWVGEAAGLTSAATGEGIWHALASGVAAAETVADIVRSGDDARLAGYRRRCAKALGVPLKSAALFSRGASSRWFSPAVHLAGTGVGGRLSTALLERLLGVAPKKSRRCGGRFERIRGRFLAEKSSWRAGAKRRAPGTSGTPAVSRLRVTRGYAQLARLTCLLYSGATP
jgi:geranylgeranyl reductase family protein